MDCSALRVFVVSVAPKEEARGFEGFNLLSQGFCSACKRCWSSCLLGKVVFFLSPPSFPSSLSVWQSKRGSVKTTLILWCSIAHTNTEPYTHSRSIKQMTFMRARVARLLCDFRIALHKAAMLLILGLYLLSILKLNFILLLSEG